MYNKLVAGAKMADESVLDISVVVPVYNEEENIEKLCTDLRQSLDRLKKSYEVICTDDGSADKSIETLARISKTWPNLKIIELLRNYGQTAAMMAGVDQARGEIIVPIDADGQNDPEDISRLLDKLDEGFDVVSGWRQDRQDDALKRNFVSRIANKLISKISGVHLHDYGCTLKAYRSKVIKDVRLYGEMHRFIPIYAHWMGGKITEIPVKHHSRVYGESKYGLERIFKVILDLLVVKFLDKHFVKPSYVFGGFGLLTIIMSFVSGFVMVYLKIFHDVSMIQTPLLLLSVMLFLVGFISVLMGLLAEMIVRTYFESQNRAPYQIDKLINFEDS